MILDSSLRKAIHSVGAVCPFTISITPQSIYTGLLKPGNVSGLIRMGPAADLFGFGSGGLVPGIGMKFFRTGHPSGNVIMLHSLDSLPGYNFFSVPLSNHIPSQPGSFGTKILEKKFCQTERCISKVGISNLCSPDQDGNWKALWRFLLRYPWCLPKSLSPMMSLTACKTLWKDSPVSLLEPAFTPSKLIEILKMRVESH